VIFNGKLHREDGPAGEFADGTKRWYHYGKLHHEDGPADEYANGVFQRNPDAIAI
jgi:hypothetical protein